MLCIIVRQKSRRPVGNPWPKYLNGSIGENQGSVTPTQLHLSCLSMVVMHIWHMTLVMAVMEISLWSPGLALWTLLNYRYLDKDVGISFPCFFKYFTICEILSLCFEGPWSLLSLYFMRYLVYILMLKVSQSFSHSALESGRL